MQSSSSSSPPPLPPDRLAAAAFSTEELAQEPAAAPPAPQEDEDFLRGDLSPEEALEMSRAPYSRQLQRILAVGLTVLVLLSAGSWVLRGMATAREGSLARLATFARVLTESRLATPTDLVELGQAWSVTVETMRDQARVGSARRTREELEAAGAGMALAVRGTELLTDSTQVIDVADRVLVADLVQRISYDPVVLGLTNLQRQYADTLLVRAVEATVAQVRLIRQTGQTAADLERGTLLANRLADVLGTERGTAWRRLADSLGGLATAQRLAGDNTQAGASPATMQDSAALAERVRGTVQIQRYLTEQGINVTAVGVDARLTTQLVVRGLATSDELAVLLVRAPAARQRLTELGFTELKTEGTDGARRYDLRTGTALAPGAGTK